MSAESDNYDEKKNDFDIDKSSSSSDDNCQNSFVFVNPERDNIKINYEKKASFEKNVKDYLYSSLNFVKESYDYISQSNSL